MRIAVGMPTSQLMLPSSISTALDAAVRAGREEAEGWARIHPTGSTNRFDRDAFGSIEAPPTGDAQRAELAQLHQLEGDRDDAGIARAHYLSGRAGWDEWEAAITSIGRSQGPEQARLAQRLLDESAGRTHEIVNKAKHDFGRPRPYVTDPTLNPIVAKTGGNPAYPSGHASGAYAAALVLAAFLPERADELVSLASEVAYARMYGGVHYLSDVVTGARIASRVAADVLRRNGLA